MTKIPKPKHKSRGPKEIIASKSIIHLEPTRKQLTNTRTQKMGSERLGEKLGISEEVIKKSCSLSLNPQQGFPEQLFHVENRSSDAVFISFTRCWFVADWFSGKKAFGETKIDLQLFPSMKSIGNEDVAVVNQAFLERFWLVLENPQFHQEVRSAIFQKKQIIFTGHSAGGAIAVLATLWYLENHSKANSGSRAHCVTFGSPLVGDFILSHAVKREKWSQYFIHFVMRYDIVPRILLAPHSSIQRELEQILHYFDPKIPNISCESVAPDFYTTVMRNASCLASHAACKLMGNTNHLVVTITNFIKLSPYRPFGAYIFCTGNGKLVHLENSEAVLQLMFYSCQLNNESEMQATATRCINEHSGYENELLGNENSLDMQDVVYVDILEELPLGSDGGALDDLGLSAKARLCLRAAGALEKQKGKNGDQIKAKMDEINTVLIRLEEYRAFYEHRLGYYDAFKKQDERRDFDANVWRLVLAGIWDEIIEMLKRYDLPDEFEGQSDWIELGTRFRRVVEPLDIANYYRHAKNEDTGAYMQKGRPRRYRYTQKWLEKINGLPAGSCGESCFFAEVEELLKIASNGGRLDKARAEKLQKDVVQWMEHKVVSKDVFLGECTFMKLWEELGRQKLQMGSLLHLMNSK